MELGSNSGIHAFLPHLGPVILSVRPSGQHWRYPKYEVFLQGKFLSILGRNFGQHRSYAEIIGNLSSTAPSLLREPD